MEMHQVRYFLASARHLNFTRAAAELNVAQPSLTRAIQNLEAELGGPLFRRERANTHLTELGRLMLPHLQATYFAAEAAKNEARRLKRRDVGSLTLGVSAGIDAATPAALVLETASRLQNLDLSVEVAPAEIIERRLVAGEFDAAVLVTDEHVDSRFDLCPISRNTLVIAFSDDHRFRHNSSVSLESLDDEPMIFNFGSSLDDAFAAAMHSRGLNSMVRHRSNDPNWTAEFVRKGLGCTVLTKAAAVSYALAHRSITGLSIRHDTMLATVAGRRHTASLSKLIEHIQHSSTMTPVERSSFRVSRE